MEDDTKKMNIYEKLTLIQNDLLTETITKSGKNKFGGFEYYELDDLLPPILKLCKKYGCTLFFNFPTKGGECKSGVLNLVNWNDKHDKILVEVPFPKLEKLPKMNYAQSSGTYQTYMKRYLILHTFDIVESDTIDATITETVKNNNNNSKKNTKVTKTIKAPKILQKVIEKCHEEHGEKECDKSLLNSVSLQMAKNKEITRAERAEIYNYLQTL